MTTARLVRHVLRWPGKILLVKPSSLGDVVHAFPVAALLRRSYGKAKISWLVNDALKDVAEASPYVDEVIPFDREQLRGLGTLLNGLAFGGLLARIRDEHYDIVVDLQGLFRSAFISRASGAPVRLGFAGGRELSHTFYNLRVHLPKRPMHAVDRYLRAVRALGIRPGRPDFSMRIDAETRSLVLKLLGEFPFRSDGPIIVVSPFTRWKSKNWPLSHFAQVARRAYAEFRARLVLVAASREDAERLAALVDVPMLNLAGATSLRELIAVISEADLFLTGDSGPMHIADALGVPLVAIFGPTDPERTGPYFQRDGVVRANVACGPCFSRRCKKDKPECQYAVSPERVFDVLARKLRSPG